VTTTSPGEKSGRTTQRSRVALILANGPTTRTSRPHNVAGFWTGGDLANEFVNPREGNYRLPGKKLAERVASHYLEDGQGKVERLSS